MCMMYSLLHQFSTDHTSCPSPSSNPKKAIDFAFQAKDSNGLIRIMDRHPDDMELKNMVESYLQRLGGGEMRRVGSNHDNHSGWLHGIQHVMDYYLYMFCVEQCAVAVMCATGTQNYT